MFFYNLRYVLDKNEFFQVLWWFFGFETQRFEVDATRLF